MAMKTCRYCGIVPIAHECPVVAKQRSNYRNSKEDAKIYNTNEWKELREDIISEYKSICLWSLYVDGIIKHIECCHHIVEVNIDKDLAYEKDNVIGLNKDTHDYVHKLYKSKYKQEVVKLLRQMKCDWDKGKKLEYLGVYKSLVDSWVI